MQIRCNSGANAYLTTDPRGEFVFHGVAADCDLKLKIMSSAAYRYIRVIRLNKAQMNAGDTVTLPDIVMPALREPNVELRFTFEGGDDWTARMSNGTTPHSQLHLRALDGSFEAITYGRGDVAEFRLPPGSYVVEEFQQEESDHPYFATPPPRVVKASGQFDVAPGGAVETTVTIKQPTE